VLPIGLNHAQTVDFRNQISIDWIGQQALNTGDTLANGVDVKHADCNGDGQINAIDIDAITANYNYVHYSEKSTNAECNFPLYVVKPSLIKEDEALTIQIGLDLSANPLQDVYGITFTLEYDTQFVVPGTITTQGVNAWFGTENANYLKVNIDDFPAGKMDVAVVGIDHLNRNGGGILLDGIWTMEDVVIPIAQGFDTTSLVISNVTIIDYNENVIDACGGRFDFQVYDKNVGIVERTYGHLEMYPNPSQQSIIQLKNIENIEKVEAYDLQGKLLQVWNGVSSNISLEGFSTGVYFIKAYTKEATLTNKLIYNKI
jgi:hypothetical protein